MGNCCGICLNKIRNRKSASSQLNILLLGLDGAGKTEVLHVLLKKKRDDLAPTNGTKNHNFCLHGIDVNLKELGGSKDIRDIWKHYYQEAHGAIFIVDCTDHNRLLAASRLLTSIFLQSKLTGKPMLVLGNKQDQPEAIDYLDLASFLDIDHVANISRTPCYVSTIGRNDYEDLHKGMRWLLGTISMHLRRIHNQNRFFLNSVQNGAADENGVSQNRPKTGSRIRKKVSIEEARPNTAPHAISTQRLKFFHRVSPANENQIEEAVYVLDLDNIEQVDGAKSEIFENDKETNHI